MLCSDNILFACLVYHLFNVNADGTTNFAHCYPSFAVSIAVLYKGKPAAAAVVSELMIIIN